MKALIAALGLLLGATLIAYGIGLYDVKAGIIALGVQIVVGALLVLDAEGGNKT